MSQQKLVVITGGGSRHSNTAVLGERLRDSTLTSLAERRVEATHTTHHLGQFAYDIADYLSDGFPSDTLAEVLEDVRSATGIIAISPVFKASYSGLFKLFWDITQDGDIAYTPTLLAAVGGSGRHSLVLDHAMRPLFGYLDADTVPKGVYATPEELTGSGRHAEMVDERVSRSALHLAQKMVAAEHTL